MKHMKNQVVLEVFEFNHQFVKEIIVAWHSFIKKKKYVSNKSI